MFEFLGPFAEYVVAVLLLVVFLIAAKLVNIALKRYVSRITRRTKSELDDMMLRAVQRPLFIGIFLVGLYFALDQLTILAPYAAGLNVAFTVIYGFYGAFLAVRIINTFLEWYGKSIATKTQTKIDEQFLPIFKKLVYIIVFGLTFLWVLGQLGIQITTLIAAMGIGGLAIALALQEPLSNFFSGANIIIDRPIKIGDYIELDTGDKGTVTDIGWRSTKIRNYMNNIVVIPNKTMANSKIINYHTPTEEVGFSIKCGVAYDSDLEKVEKVVLQVAGHIVKKYCGLENFKPKLRFREFGDSAINFILILRAKKYSDQFLARHELIKQLKKRFDKEKIEIAFPQMDVHMKK